MAAVEPHVSDPTHPAHERLKVAADTYLATCAEAGAELYPQLTGNPDGAQQMRVGLPVQWVLSTTLASMLQEAAARGEFLGVEDVRNVAAAVGAALGTTLGRVSPAVCQLVVVSLLQGVQGGVSADFTRKTH